MLPLSLLKTAQNHPMLVELKNGETYNGHLVSCDNWMNINLREVICTSRVSDFTGRMHCWTGGTVPSMTPLSNRTVTSSGECLSATSVAAPSSTCASLMRSLTWCGRRPPRAEGEGGHSSRSSRKAEAWAALAEVCLVAGAGVASQVRAEVKRRRSQGGKQASSEGTQPEQSPARWASHQRLCMKPPAPTDSASCWSHRVSTYQAGLSLRSRLHTSSDMKIKGASEGPAVPSVTCRNSRSTCIYVSVHLSSGPAPRWESGADPALTRIK